MEIILKQDIDNVGNKNEIVVVKPGFARNYLIPQGMAIVATGSAKKVLAENIRQRAHKEAKILDQAQALATRLEGITLSIGTKAGENGKIFGSVNNIQIAEALATQGIDIERKQILLKEDTIKELGTYEAQVKLHKQVIATVKFEVVGE